MKALDYNFIKEFVEIESSIYLDDGIVSYISDENLAVSILTDTTERSPTFSLMPFESKGESHLSLCYLTIKGSHDTKDAWKKLLKREPRGIDWAGLDNNIGLEDIYSFDISEGSVQRRHYSSGKQHNNFEISLDGNKLVFQLEDCHKTLNIGTTELFMGHLAVKLLLNSMSTLIMGKLERYESNIMTWVRPSNLKLIDRATRYCLKLLEMKGIDVSYEEIAGKVITISKEINNDQPIVLEVIKQY